MEAPEAAPGPAYPNGTNASLITPQGLIVGTYFDANSTSHVFLRANDGTFTTLVVPGAAGLTGGLVCNTEGAIAGGFYDSSSNNYGFLRASSGKITVFAMPTSLPDFVLVGMTAGGEILGSSLDSNFVNHGFVRAANGSITTFDVPNAAPYFYGGTTPTSINNGGIGAVVGSVQTYICTPDGCIYSASFLRTPAAQSARSATRRGHWAPLPVPLTRPE